MQEDNNIPTSEILRLTKENERLNNENGRLTQEIARLQREIEVLSARLARNMKTASVSSEKLEIPLSQLRLSRRTDNLLRSNGFKTLGDIVRRRREQMNEIPYFGTKCLYELDQVILSHGLSWEME